MWIIARRIIAHFAYKDAFWCTEWYLLPDNSTYSGAQANDSLQSLFFTLISAFFLKDSRDLRATRGLQLIFITKITCFDRAVARKNVYLITWANKNMIMKCFSFIPRHYSNFHYKNLAKRKLSLFKLVPQCVADAQIRIHR